MGRIARRGVVCSLAAWGGAASLTLGACAAAAPLAPAEPLPVGMRVLVKLVRPSEDGEAIAAAAARQAGVAIRYASAASPVWHALALRCADAAQCEAAIARLRDDRATYEVVERESRQKRAVM